MATTARHAQATDTRAVIPAGSDDPWRLHEAIEEPLVCCDGAPGDNREFDGDLAAPPWVRALGPWSVSLPRRDLPVAPEEPTEPPPASGHNNLLFSDGEVNVRLDTPSSLLADILRCALNAGSSFSRDAKEAPARGPTEVRTMAAKKEDKESQMEDRTPAAAPPVAKFVAGGVQLAVWANRGANDRLFHSVTMDRRYLAANGEWKSSSSLRMNDIPKAILVLQKAYERMVLNRNEDTDAAGEEAATQGGDAPLSPAQRSSRVQAVTPPGDDIDEACAGLYT